MKVTTKPESEKEWKKILKRIDKIHSGKEKGVVFVLDKNGWHDISNGKSAYDLLTAIMDWKEFVEKETQTFILREKLN